MTGAAIESLIGTIASCGYGGLIGWYVVEHYRLKKKHAELERRFDQLVENVQRTFSVYGADMRELMIRTKEKEIIARGVPQLVEPSTSKPRLYVPAEPEERKERDLKI